ncbi:MAG: hypothetical protein ACE5Z5_08490 [Candidatus Bathyarchaeia archaeon]
MGCLEIETACNLENFRWFLIISTCRSFIPEEYLEDRSVFPERAKEHGTMYVEAEDKVTLRVVRNIVFSQVSNVLGVIYNSKSGRSRLKWRSLRGSLGRVTGEASTNSLVNLFEAGVLDKAYVKALELKKGDSGKELDTEET